VSDIPAVQLRDVFLIHPAEGSGAVALQGLTLQVRRGERCVVLGPSGSGKSSLLRVAAGFERPSAGVARTLGVDLGSLSAGRSAAFRTRHLGFLDQHYARSLSPALSCAGNVELPLRLAGEPASSRRRRALELLGRVGLDERADHMPNQLSGGEQQRVAACVALARRPAVLFADEPAGELDATTAASVYELLAELAASDGATLVVVSHDERASELADRVVQVRSGRIVAETHHGEATRLVVGRGGWLHLPENARRMAGIGPHASWQVSDGQVRVAGDHVAVAPTLPAQGMAFSGVIAAELRDVGKSYGSGNRERRVLVGFGASFEPGRLVALMGRSGSGKTTLLHLIAGLERPDTGSITVAGEELTVFDREELAAHRRAHVGWVGQEPGLIPFASALENATLGLEIRDGARRQEHEPEARNWLERVGLEDCIDRMADRLSAGERQRVAIARALARRPDVLLLDEPTARLDEDTTASIADLLLVSARASSAAVICATHDPAVAERADTVITLERQTSTTGKTSTTA
jgi:ABC-type lipoprotein export system ATPase subunit